MTFPTTFVLPMSLPSTANLREHWSAKAKRAKAHRTAARLAVGRPLRERNWLTLGGRVVVTLTRVSPRALDSDNLASAFKNCRDGVADALGIDDGDDRLAWHYAQAKGTQAVRIGLECVERAEMGAGA